MMVRLMRLNDKDITRGQALHDIMENDKVLIAYHSPRGVEIEYKAPKDPRDEFVEMIKDKLLERIEITGKNGITKIWENDVNDLVGHWFMEYEEI